MNILFKAALGTIFLAARAGAQVRTVDEKDILNSAGSGKVLIQFTSLDEGCSFCMQSNEFIDQVAPLCANKLKVLRVSWEPWSEFRQSQSARPAFRIQSVPLFVYLENGTEVWRHSGFKFGSADTQALSGKIQKLCQ